MRRIHCIWNCFDYNYRIDSNYRRVIKPITKLIVIIEGLLNPLQNLIVIIEGLLNPLQKFKSNYRRVIKPITKFVY